MLLLSTGLITVQWWGGVRVLFLLVLLFHWDLYFWVWGMLRVGGLGVCCSRPWWAGGLGKQGLRGDLLKVCGLGVCCSRPWWAGGLGKQGLRGDLGGCHLSLGVWGCEFGE